MIQQLLHKWFCLHKWKVHYKNETHKYEYSDSKYPYKSIRTEVLVCEICGKIHIINIEL